MIFFVLLSRLPLPVLYGLSDLLYFLIYRIFGYRKSVVRNNLRNSFPEKEEAELLKIEKEFYTHLCDVVVETIKLITISEKELKERVSHENPRVLDAEYKNGHSFVTMATHMGNWEWLLVANKIYIGCEIDAVYKPLSSPFFDKLMLRIRGRLGIFPVASNRILRIETARKGITRCIAMAADQTPGHEGSFVRTFLNQPTLFFKGPQKIAEMFSYPVYYSGIRKLGRGKYQLFVEKIADAPLPEGDKILEIFADKMERDIRENPSIWLWSHKRWKHRIPEQMLETLKNKKSSSEEGTLL